MENNVTTSCVYVYIYTPTTYYINYEIRFLCVLSLLQLVNLQYSNENTINHLRILNFCISIKRLNGNLDSRFKTTLSQSHTACIYIYLSNVPTSFFHCPHFSFNLYYKDLKPEHLRHHKIFLVFKNIINN